MFGCGMYGRYRGGKGRAGEWMGWAGKGEAVGAKAVALGRPLEGVLSKGREPALRTIGMLRRARFRSPALQTGGSRTHAAEDSPRIRMRGRGNEPSRQSCGWGSRQLGKLRVTVGGLVTQMTAEGLARAQEREAVWSHIGARGSKVA